MITTDQLKKALAMRESKMTWGAIADTIGVDVEELRTTAEKKAGRSLPDRAKVTAALEQIDKKHEPRVIEGYTVTREAFTGYMMRPGPKTLAPHLQAGDCVKGIRFHGWAVKLRAELRPRGLDCKSVKRRNEKLWDVYIINSEAK